MDKKELHECNELADKLEKTLRRITKLWQEVPNEDEIAEIDKAAGSLAVTLETARERFNADDFPSEDRLNEVDRSAGSLAQSLEAAREHFNADDFPNEDSFHELAKKAVKLDAARI